MGVVSALVGGAIDGHGKKPKVPELPTISPSEVQGEAIAGNIKALPGIDRLAGGVTDITSKQLKRGLDLALPGQRQKVTDTIAAQLRGEIPEDVSLAVQRSAAETGFGGGFQGSGLNRGLTLRDLGLTSLDIQQQGFQNFQSLARMVTGPGLDPTAMFFSPQQRLSFAFRDRSERFSRDMTAAQVEAAPSPFAAAMTKGIAETEKDIWRFAGALAGSAGAAAGAAGAAG